MDCVRQRIATSENVEPVTRTACVAWRRTPNSAAAATSRPTAPATAPCVALNTYFGAPLMFFFFRGWLHGAAAADGPVARVLAAGLPGRARKAGVLVANFAVLLAVAFAK